jgi:hypothetical protein
MRYLPGTISLNEGRDYPVLSLVLHSRFIEHQQLFDLLRLEHCESSRQAFDHRVKRLASHDLLRTQTINFVGRVYSITPSGLAPLIRKGECYSLGPREKQSATPGTAALMHALGVNDIRVRLQRTGMLLRWLPESMIRSRNEFTSIGYAKDYDAITTISLANQTFEVALEYERTAKSSRHYAWIEERIEAEQQLDHFLYLCASFDLMMFVASRFHTNRKRVYFALLQDFLADPMAARVKMGRSALQSSLGATLIESKEITNRNMPFAVT